MSYDHFRPRHEPARSIYDAFQAEAAHRKGRALDDWLQAEVRAVHETASRLAPEHGLRAPSLTEVERAEAYARGSIDYGAKWAYTLVNALRRPAAN